MEEEEAISSPSPVVPAPTLAVGTDNETSGPKTSPPPKRQTRSESRFASFVIPSILEPPMDDDLEPEESLTGPIAAKDRAASSLAKGPASKGPPKTADRRRGQPSVAESGHTSASGILYPWYEAVQGGTYWYIPVHPLLDTRRYEKCQNCTYQYIPVRTDT